MSRITATLDEEQLEFVGAVKEEEDLESDAAAVRECIDRARDAQDSHAEVQRLHARVQELQNQLMAANQRIDSANELVEYVEEEQSLERRRRQASLATRTKWWLFGMPDG